VNEQLRLVNNPAYASREIVQNLASLNNYLGDQN
jgi:hypothetical protein